MKVLILALHPTRRAAVLSDSTYLLEHGAHITLITVAAGSWRDLDPRVQIIDVSEVERAHPIPRGVRILLFAIPRRGFALLRRLIHASSRTPTTMPASRFARTVDRADTFWQRTAQALHRRFLKHLYRDLFPWVVWRVARRRILPGIRPHELDLVLVADASSVPIAWHLARHYPELHISFSLARQLAPDDSGQSLAASQIPERGRP
jgi:hypothetical protein